MEQNTFNSNNIDAGSKIASFRVKQSMPYEFKVNYARIRAWEFYNECGKRDLDCYVSVGGQYYTVLLLEINRNRCASGISLFARRC